MQVKSKVSIYQSQLSGGLWAWSLWKLNDTGNWAIIHSEYGFHSSIKAKKAFKLFQRVAANPKMEVKR